MSDNTYTLRKLSRPAKSRNGVTAPAAVSKQSSSSSYLSILEQKLDKAVFDDLFEKVTVGDNTWIKAKYSLYSVGSVSGKGPGEDGAVGGGASYGLLQEWSQYQVAEGKQTALSAFLGKDLLDRVSQLESGSNINLDGYATKQWVGQQGFLTDHQTIYGLSLKAGAFSAKTYTPASAAAEVCVPTTTDHLSEGANLFFTAARAQSALSGHTGDTAIHITSTERTKWNKVVTDLADLFEKVTIDGNSWIRAKYSFYTDGSLSGKGPGLGGSGSGDGGYGLMREWPAMAPDSSTLLALGANLGYDLYTRLLALETNGGGLNETQLAAYLTTNNYAKKSDIPSLSPYLKVDGSNGTAAGLTAMINKLLPGDANITDSTMLVTSHNTNPDGNNYYRRSATYLWGYIKGKADSVYATSGHTHNVIINGETKTISATGAPAVNLGTFLTAHQSLANYYTKSEVDTKDKRLTTYYASRPASANVNFGNNTGLYTFLATTSMTAGKPTCGDAHILHAEWDNSSSGASQIALPTTLNASMQWRQQNGTTWQSWRTLLDTSNFNTLIGSNLTAYVKKAGDTMSGVLNINTNSRTLTLGCQNTAWAHYNVDASEGHYFNKKVAVNGEIYAGSGYNNRVFHKGFMGSGSGLDADLLDGLEAISFVRQRVCGWTANEDVAAWAKRYIASNVPTIYNTSGWAWADSVNIKVGSYSLDLMRYSAIDFRRGDLNSTYQQKAILFLPTYSDSSMMYIAQMFSTNVAGTVTTSVKRYADYDTILASTVANANSLGGKAASQYVTTDTAQTISAEKTFSANVTLNAANAFFLATATTKKTFGSNCVIHGGGDRADSVDANLRFGSWYGIGWYPTVSGQTVPQGENAMWLNVRSGDLTVRGRFIKSGGTSSQFLKADGSVDSNSYLTTGSAASTYVKKAGDTMTGPLVVSGEIISTSANAFRAICGNYGCFIRNDGVRTWFMLTDSGDQYGVYNSLRPMNINNSTGLVTIGNGLSVDELTIGGTIKLKVVNGVLEIGGSAYTTGSLSGKGPAQ